jgi:hypothetical protein
MLEGKITHKSPVSMTSTVTSGGVLSVNIGGRSEAYPTLLLTEMIGYSKARCASADYNISRTLVADRLLSR